MTNFMTLDDSVVPMQHPSVLIELLRSRGVSNRDILLGTSIPEAAISSPDARITYRQFSKLIGNALTASGDRALGLDFGSRIHLHNQGMLGLLILNCATVGEAIDACLTFHHTVSPNWELSLDVEGSAAHLRARPCLPLGRLTQFASESLFASLDKAISTIAPTFEIQELRLAYPRPSYADRYPFAGARRLRFDCECSEIVFDAELLQLRLTSPDRVTAELARRQCVAAVAPTRRGLIERIRNHLDGSPGAYPSMQALASKLGTSPRSLRRHLRALSTNYQSLVDEARRVHAEAAVRSTGMTVQELADFLGYGDARGFRRAWRRWTGETPSSYRAAL